ncbi:MAG: helix-turn-helix domain-containing protein [Persephonella sp.]|nr:helix-turn-helix domain-containing protein [Persephonella sp.]
MKERKEDIPLLVESILKQLKNKYRKNIKKISPQFLNYLMHYDFKGNIRELRNILEKAVILSEGEELDVPFISLTNMNSIYIDDPEEKFTVKTFPEEGVELKKVLSNIERALLEKALEISDGNKTKAADILGLTFREFRYRYSKYLSSGE